MKYFTKVTTDEFDPRMRWLFKNPLALAVLMVCAARARRSDNQDLELRSHEFVISETETDVFGLSKSQHGKLNRAIKKLIEFNFIEKTGSKTGIARCHIYRYVPNQSIYWMKETGSETGLQQGTDRERIGNEQGGTKNDKNGRMILVSKDTNANSEGKPVKKKKEPDPNIDLIGELFKQIYGITPIDSKWRFEAWNLLAKMKGKFKERGKEATQEKMAELIRIYFRWLERQEWQPTRMRAVRENFEVFYAEKVAMTRKGVMKNAN